MTETETDATRDDCILPSIDEMRMAYPAGLFNAADRDGPTSRELRREVAEARSEGATRRDLVDGAE